VKELFLVAGVTFAALTPMGSVTAADMYPPPPVVSEWKPPAETWTGPYVGIAFGGKYANTTWAATSLRDPPGVLLGGIQNPIDQTSPRTYNPLGLRAGGYVGYNWQVNPIYVVGIEADFAWAARSQTATGLPGCAGHVVAAGVASGCTLGVNRLGSPGTDFAIVDMLWDGSVRARAGYMVANLWFYGTGGVAWQKMSTTAICDSFTTSDYCLQTSGPRVEPQFLESTRTRMGWTAGGGLEGRIVGNWLLRGEYRYASFGTWNEVAAFTPAGAGSNTYRYQVSVQTHIVTFGLGYKFDWGNPSDD
jgi:outer membrane immunogenic protein